MIRKLKERLGLTVHLKEDAFSKGIMYHNCKFDYTPFLKIVDFYINKTNFHGVILDPDGIIEKDLFKNTKKKVFKVDACDSLDEYCMNQSIDDYDVIIITGTNNRFTNVFYDAITFAHNANARAFHENGRVIDSDKKPCRFFLTYNAMEDMEKEPDNRFKHDNIAEKLRMLRACGTSIIYFEDKEGSVFKQSSNPNVKQVMEPLGLVANRMEREFAVSGKKLTLPYGIHNVTHKC